MSDRCLSVCAGASGEVVPSGESGERLVRGGGLSELVLNEIWVSSFLQEGQLLSG